jgi:hypothetical protein
MPGARCTRSLVCARGNKYAHEYSQRVTGNSRHSPRNGLRLIPVLSPAIGLLTPSLAKKLRQLDAGTEASGPHVFAVRVGIARQARRHVHRPPSRVRDVRETPL